MKKWARHFGGKLNEELLSRYGQSPNWKEGSFRNLEPTEVMPGLYKMPGMIMRSIKGTPNGTPSTPIPIIPFQEEQFLDATDEVKYIWYGHSVVLLRIKGCTILIDPMFGPDTSPIAPITTRRFSEHTLAIIDVLPPIDLCLITHDHYDHLDMESIDRLKGKVHMFYVALGVKRHLLSWGVPEQSVREFDWWDEAPFDHLQLHFTPTRHFSGRGLTDRAKSLWGGWVIDTGRQKIWFSGDSGYGTHFKEIGSRFNGFDLAFMECGQYSSDWPLIHMFPEESVQAAVDAGARHIVPVHWAGFRLSYAHSWHEPAERFVLAAIENGVSLATPEPGSIQTMVSDPNAEWWLSYC